jgi:hypothetical protein
MNNTISNSKSNSESKTESKNNNYEKKYVQSILDCENFELSDTDDENDDDFKTLIEQNKYALDDIELKYYPEPYNFLGQFIVSAISGAYTIYLINIKNRKLDDELEYHKYLDMYYKYCKNTKNDDYITKLCSNLKIKDTDDKYNTIFDKSNQLCKKIMDEMIKLKISDKITNIDISDKFNFELFNLITPFIKFSDINNCLL